MKKKAPTTSGRAAYAAQVYRLVRRIPRGRVMTYGEIADCLPAPRGVDPIAYRRIRARWVGYAMAEAPPDVPWQRVVNARGQVSLREGFGPDLQRSLLKAEGIRLTRDGVVDLKRYRWTPRTRG